MTRFRHFRLIASVLSAAALTGAGAQTLVPFSNPQLPFTFSHPKGWFGINLGDKTNGVSMVSAKTPPATMVRLLFVPNGGKTGDLEKQFDGFEKGINSTGVQATKQSSRSASYGGLKGIEREYLVTKSAKSVKMRIWFAQDNKNMYSFQLTDTPPRYAAASAVFNQMLGTVKFK